MADQPNADEGIKKLELERVVTVYYKMPMQLTTQSSSKMKLPDDMSGEKFIAKIIAAQGIAVDFHRFQGEGQPLVRQVIWVPYHAIDCVVFDAGL